MIIRICGKCTCTKIYLYNNKKVHLSIKVDSTTGESCFRLKCCSAIRAPFSNDSFFTHESVVSWNLFFYFQQQEQDKEQNRQNRKNKTKKQMKTSGEELMWKEVKRVLNKSIQILISFSFAFPMESAAEVNCGLARQKQRIHLHVHIKVRWNTIIHRCKKSGQPIGKSYKLIVH